MPCWKCGKKSENGYIVEVRLVGPSVSGKGTSVTAPVCWPCIKAVNDALGKQHPNARPERSGKGCHTA